MAKGRRRNAAVAAPGVARPGRRGRGGRGSNREARLADVISKLVDELVAAVDQEVRRSIADEVLTGNGVPARAGVRGRRGAAPGRRRVVNCIAPGCTNPSKGPRFHYLCEKHKDAPKKDYEAWRKARQEKQAA